MKNNITLAVDHPSKKRMEYFLNRVNEKIEDVPFDWRAWKLAAQIQAGYKFKNADRTLTITVIFTDSYAEATEIATANALPLLPHAKWSVNGDLLYLVESTSENTVSNILGLFAGEE